MTVKAPTTRIAIRHGAASGLAAAVLFLTAPAGAQSMDYGALEELFKGPVTASATGTPQRDTDVPVNMTIVTADEIRRSGARDLAGVLRHVPGIDTLQWGSDNTDVSIRGFNQVFSSGTLVMIDGRQVYADYYGFVPWSALPVELGAIRQIEVVKGPNNALFGFNAASGAINIITYNPRYDAVNKLTLTAGDPSLGEVSGVATLRLGAGGGMRLSAGYRNNDDFSTPVPAILSGAARKANERAAADIDLVYGISEGVEIAFAADHSDAHVNELSPNYSIQNSMYQTNSVQGRVTADSAWGMLQIAGYTNWIEWKGTPNPRLGEFEMNDRLTVVRVEDLFTIGTQHTLRLAVGYRNDEVNTAPVKGGTLSQDDWSGAVMWHWEMTPALALTTALRLDHLAPTRSGTMPVGYPYTNAEWDRTFNELSYNIGLVWTASDEDTLRLIFSRGVELPSQVKAGALVISTPYFNVTGNPALRSTAVTNDEIAWSHEIPSVAARLQTALFYEIKHNVASVGGGLMMTAGGPYALPENIGDSRAWGLETTAQGTIDSAWHWSVSYRVESTKDDFLPFAAGGTDFVDFQHTTPKHQIKAGLGWSAGRWEADAYLGWQSHSAGLVWPSNATGADPIGMVTSPARVDDFAAVDARIAYKLADWATIAVSGQNLLQTQQRQTIAAEVGRQLEITLTLAD